MAEAGSSLSLSNPIYKLCDLGGLAFPFWITLALFAKLFTLKGSWVKEANKIVPGSWHRLKAKTFPPPLRQGGRFQFGKNFDVCQLNGLGLKQTSTSSLWRVGGKRYKIGEETSRWVRGELSHRVIQALAQLLPPLNDAPTTEGKLLLWKPQLKGSLLKKPFQHPRHT